MKQPKAKVVLALLLAIVFVVSTGIILSKLEDSADSENEMETVLKENKTAPDFHPTDTIKDRVEESTDAAIEDVVVNETKHHDEKVNPEKASDMQTDNVISSDTESNTVTSNTEIDNSKADDTNHSNTTNNETKTGTTKEYETTANVNLREGASTNHEVITMIPKGEKVICLSTSGDWFEVKYGGKTGFVSSDYLIAPSKATSSTPEEEITPTYINGVLIVNKEYPLPANYAPGESWEARQAFNKMAEAAKQDGIGLHAFSTYRSYTVQKQLYDRYVARDGQAAADRYSAKPGHSEHQTGLAFDICEEGKYSTYTQKSDATIWLAENAHKYGFILRYPEGKEHITGYMYEHWHYRYLGVDMATKVYNSGLTLEEYLGAY